MKTRESLTFIAIVAGLSLCWLMIERAAAQNRTAAQDAAQQSDQQYRQLLDEQASMLKRSATLLTEQEAFFKKQEKAFERYERILDTWDKQQRQYQKYLDSLDKK